MARHDLAAFPSPEGQHDLAGVDPVPKPLLEPHIPTVRTEASGQQVVLDAEIAVDRTLFAMTWSPLGMAAATARGTVVARIVRP